MLEQLFCNHDFVYVDRELKVHFPGEDEYLFKFICKKCKRKKFISSLDIENTYIKFERDLNEMIAIDKFVDVSTTRLTLPTRGGYHHVDLLMVGYAVDKTIEYFKSKYFIDITQVDELFKTDEDESIETD
ncbi:MAG: hypothetical protein ACLUVC_13595 [Longibaculum sp.]